MVALPDDIDKLRRMLDRRDVLHEIKAEMKLTPEIQAHLAELLDSKLLASGGAVSGTIEIPIQAAKWLLEICRPKKRGRPPAWDDKIGVALICKIAKLRKAEIVSTGETATGAHARAAEEAACEAGTHGINLAADTIARGMDDSDI